MRLTLPSKVNMILDQLHAAGYEAYAVGGCVRDSLLGKEPHDWDITTSAKPEEVKAIFTYTADTGIEHGTVTVLTDREGFEVTTYRIDGEYEDARHPKEVAFTACLTEDLKRRDFTINAMAYNEAQGLVDLFGGIQDLESGLIRCVGEPKERFSEDALRMLRAVRFSAQLGFAIEDATREAIQESALRLSQISAERIRDEFVKLLVSPRPDQIRELYELGLSAVVFPWFDIMMKTPQLTPYHQYSVGEHTIHALLRVPQERILRLAILFHDVGKPASLVIDEKDVYHFYGHAKKSAELTPHIMRELRFDNDTIERVTALVRWHGDAPPLTEAAVRKAIHRIGERQFPDLFAVKRADALSKSSLGRLGQLPYIAAYQALYEKIMNEHSLLDLKDLAVSGSDLIAAGMKPGPELGKTLNCLLEHVLEKPEDNQKEILLQLVEDK